jgi:maltose/moltooligosaccharide transporter
LSTSTEPAVGRRSPSFEDPRRLFLSLGLPTLGLAFAASILTTYGPVVLIEVADSPARVGALIGGEGAFAIAIPLLAGVLSDRLPASPLGRRLPFVFVGTPLVVAGLVLLAWAPTYWAAALAVVFFFLGYYLYYPPYRALYADVLPREMFARSQSSQAILRGAGLGAALMAGGLLLDVWKPLPFVIAGAVLVATTLTLAPIVRSNARCDEDADEAGTLHISDLFRNRQMMTFGAANSLWEFSFSGLKTFIVLYVVSGLGKSPAMASAVIAVVALAYVAGAPLASRLADRHGILPVMTWAAILYGVGLCLGSIPTTLTPSLFMLPFVALAGAVLLTLPQALAFTLAPHGGVGAAAGLIDVSRGLGLVFGPLVVGFAVDRTSGSIFDATHGYAAMFPVIGLAVLASVPLLRRLDNQGAETQGPNSQGRVATSAAAGLRAPV